MNCKKFAILILSCIFTFTVCFTSFAQLDVHNVSIRKEGNDIVIQVSGWKEQKRKASGRKSYGYNLDFALLGSDANIYYTGVTQSTDTFGYYTNHREDTGSASVNGFSLFTAEHHYKTEEWSQSLNTYLSMSYGVNGRYWQSPYVVVPKANVIKIKPYTSGTVQGTWDKKGSYSFTFRITNLDSRITRFTVIDVESWYENHMTGWGVKNAFYYCINHNGVLQKDSDKVVGGAALC